MTADQDGTGLLAQIRRISPEKFADLLTAMRIQARSGLLVRSTADLQLLAASFC
jgi:hypothetical protein